VSTNSFLAAPARRVAGCLAAFTVALFGVLSTGAPGPAQPPAKGAPSNPKTVFEQVRGYIDEGRYDIAATFLQIFVESKPTDQDYLDIEAKHGTTAFKQLRNIPKWSDDPKLNQQAKANVEEIIKQAQAATLKVLQNPQRVNKYIRNLGASYEERLYAEYELRRTGDYAVPFMVDALRMNFDAKTSSAIIAAVAKMQDSTMAGWLAALDGLPPDQQYGVLASIASRPDVLNLLTRAQTDFIPYLWKVAGTPNIAPTFRHFAVGMLEKLVRGADKKQPAAELVAAGRVFADSKARYASPAANPGPEPTTVAVWTWDAQNNKLVKQDNVPVRQADEYFGLRYGRWALEMKPDSEPAQMLVLTIAAERAMERGNFGDLARTSPAVYQMLADAPTTVLTDLLSRSLAEKRTALVLAATQAIGDRAEPTVAAAAPGKQSLLERSLAYPDPRVQLAAASALLRSPTPVPPEVRGRVLDILKRAAAADPGAPGTAKGTALISDPNRKRADDLGVLLRGLGYDVEVYTSGRELLRRVARASDFDLIFLDHHVVDPQLNDMVSHLRADANAARRPILVVASLDELQPPTIDELLLRMALLIAATETELSAMPAPYVPDIRDTPEQQQTKRLAVLQARDDVFRNDAQDRIARLQRVIETSGLELTADQRFLLQLRIEQVTYAALGAEYPLTPESAPETYRHMQQLRRQIDVQPSTPSYTRRVGISHLMRMIERFEIDVAKAKHAQTRYDKYRAKVDPVALGLTVRSLRDQALEVRLMRQLRSYEAVRVIPEPYTQTYLQSDLDAVYADPAERPRDPAEKRDAARLAVSWLSRMATGEVSGFDVKPAAAVLIQALQRDDLAEAAIDGVAHLPTGEAQQALVSLSVQPGRPVDLRNRAADAAIRHIQANGKLTPDTLIAPIVAQSRTEPELDLRAKFLVLKGLLAPNPKAYVDSLRTYSPPLLPPPPKAPMPPMPKEPEPKEPMPKEPPPAK
jgi:CheY-like chemotaxis protein